MNSTYLIIVSCSKKKKNLGKNVPAIELYDGPVFKILRKFSTLKKFDRLDILIISAKYGVLKYTDKINYYDEKMNQSKAKVMKPQIMKKISDFLAVNNYEEIFINLGKNYSVSIEGLENLVDSSCKIIYAKGRIGERLKQTKEWLLKVMN